MAQTTTETTLVTTTRQPSERLQELIDSCATGFQKLGKTIELTLELGRSEGFTDRQIGNLIRQKMLQAGLDSSTIRRHLPASAKREYNNNSKSRNLHDLELQPADYNSEQLPKYTKQFLIEIIRYLESISPNTKARIGIKPITINKPADKKSPYSRIPINKTPPEKIRQILELHNQGKSTRQIARIVDVSKSSVIRAIKSSK